LRGDATELRPIKSHREEDVAPLVPGEWTLARVELMPFAHVWRAGSRLRLSVDTPGDSRASWRFRLLEFATPPTIEIGHDAAHPSSVALPRVPGVDVPTERPACNALRGQPCRAWLPAANGG
jgi:predicted acyl esterase